MALISAQPPVATGEKLLKRRAQDLLLALGRRWSAVTGFRLFYLGGEYLYHAGSQPRSAINPLVNILLGMISSANASSLAVAGGDLALCGAGPAVDLRSLPIIGHGWLQFCLRPWCEKRKLLSMRKPACWWKRCGCCRERRQSGCSAASPTARPAGREPWSLNLLLMAAGRGDHHPFCCVYGQPRVCGSPTLLPVHRPNVDV